MARMWDEFKLTADVRETGGAGASINKRGVICLNAHAWKGFGSPEAVVLLFDKLNRVIGLRPCHPRLDNAVPVRKKYPGGKDDRMVIRAIALCHYHELTITTTLRFRNPAINKSGVLELDLRDAYEVGWQNIKRSREHEYSAFSLDP